MLKGGNAIDAAITVATCQPVVEPTGNGLGSDCFALIWYKGKLYGINGSGPAPRAASIAALKKRGFDKIPPYGVEPINVPGAVGAWMEVHKKFGKLPIKTVMEPSINYAENGYPVSPNMSRLWEEADGFYTKYKIDRNSKAGLIPLSLTDIGCSRAKYSRIPIWLKACA